MENFSPVTLFVGKQFIHLKETDSTNDFALQLLQKEKLPEGTVAFTDSQVKGKGQFGNQWLSEPGKNIALSVVLYPHFLPVEKQFYLNESISLAVYDLVKGLPHFPKGVVVKIKWPNDILINDKKLAGILIENTLSGNKISTSVIGIGMNVNQKLFPPEIPNATSLQLELSGNFDILKLAAMLCENLESRYLQLKAGKYNLLKTDYLQALYRYQEIHQYNTKEGVISGQVLGMAEDGKLIIESSGKLLYFNFKEISFV